MKSVGCLGLFLLAACTSPSSPETTRAATTQPAPATATPPVAQASPTFLFDIPALLPLSLNQIEQKLGKPAHADTPNASADELERTYSKQGQKLVITYNTKTRKAESFFLPAPGPSETITNCNKLLVAGHLRPANPTFHVDSLADEKPGVFLGVVVTRSE